MNEEKKYKVYMEDHWDFYKNPPVMPLLGEFGSYDDAVKFAKNEIVTILDSLQNDPACIYVTPEPEGEHFDSHEYEEELRIINAKELVRERIKGTRKGCDEPAYLHSIRVADTLRKYNYSEEVVIAGALHDIIEDRGMLPRELLEKGFSARIVDLVELCTHDSSIKNTDARWVKMIARLIETQNTDAWAIKLADILDNCRGCHTLSEERQRFIRTVKAPLILSVTKHLFGESGIWQELASEVY